MLHRILALVALTAVLIAGAACNDDDNGAEPTATREAPSSSPTSAPTSLDGAVPPIIDEVTEAITSGDPAQLEALLEYQSIPCTTDPPGGPGGPPVCTDGEADGTPVDVLFSATCEGNYIRKDDAERQHVVRNAVSADSTLYAAYEYAGGVAGFGPRARYFVIFSRAEPDPSAGSGTGYGVVTSETGVLGIHYGCGWTPEQFADFNELGAAIIAPE